MKGKKKMFSQLLSDGIAQAQKTLVEQANRQEFEKLMVVIEDAATGGEVTIIVFSEAVSKLLDHSLFEEGREILLTALTERTELVHHEILGKYLEKTKDEATAAVYLKKFLEIAPTKEQLTHNHPTVIALKRAVATVKVLGPEKLPAFSRTVLTAFPGLPAGADGKGGVRGLLLGYARRGQQKIASAAPTAVIDSKSEKKVYTDRRSSGDSRLVGLSAIRKDLPAGKSETKANSAAA